MPPRRRTLQIDFVHCDVRQVAAQQRLRADTVVMNPPFGTRRKGGLHNCTTARRCSACTCYCVRSVAPSHSNLCACLLPGADVEFLRAAFQLSRNSIYSLHKSSTRDFIQRLAERELRASSGEPARFYWNRFRAARPSQYPLWCCSRGAGAAALRLAGELQVPQVSMLLLRRCLLREMHAALLLC